MGIKTMSGKELPKSFYLHPTVDVARKLLGKSLVKSEKGKKKTMIIIETEAYDGFRDKASHAFKGRTARSEVMFGDPGIFYIYLCYGMYNMLNIVTREKDYPAAVLVRGGILKNKEEKILNGPGKITKFLGITNEFNNKSASKETKLWVEDRGVLVKESEIISSKRVGVNYAGHYWSNIKWRFILKS